MPGYSYPLLLILFLLYSIFADKNSPRGDGRFVGMVRPRGSKPPLPLSPVKEQETTSSSLKLSLPKMTHSQVDSSNKLQNRIHQVRMNTVTI